MGEQVKRPEQVTEQGITRVDRQIAAIVAALVIGLYLRDVVPGLLAGDAGEFQFAAWQWGLAHPCLLYTSPSPRD